MPASDASRTPARIYVREGFRYLLAGVFTAAGLLHFARPAPYLGIMPPSLPNPLALVYISGAAEIAGGIGVLAPQPLRRAAGWGLILLLIAVFPANVQMLRYGAKIGNAAIPPYAIGSWIRLPFQALFIYWVAVTTRRGGNPR